MSTPLFVLDGMMSSQRAFALDEVLDHAAVDSDGRPLVSMVDVLAIVHLAREADVLLVEFVDGSSLAFRIPDVLERDDVFLQLGIEYRVGPRVRNCRLWSQEVGATPVVASIRAMTFAAFVGSP